MVKYFPCLSRPRARAFQGSFRALANFTVRQVLHPAANPGPFHVRRLACPALQCTARAADSFSPHAVAREPVLLFTTQQQHHHELVFPHRRVCPPLPCGRTDPCLPRLAQRWPPRPACPACLCGSGSTFNWTPSLPRYYVGTQLDSPGRKARLNRQQGPSCHSSAVSVPVCLSHSSSFSPSHSPHSPLSLLRARVPRLSFSLSHQTRCMRLQDGVPRFHQE